MGDDGRRVALRPPGPTDHGTRRDLSGNGPARASWERPRRPDLGQREHRRELPGRDAPADVLGGPRSLRGGLPGCVPIARSRHRGAGRERGRLRADDRPHRGPRVLQRVELAPGARPAAGFRCEPAVPRADDGGRPAGWSGGRTGRAGRRGTASPARRGGGGAAVRCGRGALRAPSAVLRAPDPRCRARVARERRRVDVDRGAHRALRRRSRPRTRQLARDDLQ